MPATKAGDLLACFESAYERDGVTAVRELAMAVGNGMAQDLRAKRPRPWMSSLAKALSEVADDGPERLQPPMYGIVQLLLGAGGHDAGQSNAACVGLHLGDADPDLASQSLLSVPDQSVRDALGLVIEAYRPRLRAECHSCARALLSEVDPADAPYAVSISVVLLPAPLYPEQILWLLGMGENDRPALQGAIDRLVDDRGHGRLSRSPGELSRLTGTPIPEGAVGLTKRGRDLIVKHIRRRHTR